MGHDISSFDKKTIKEISYLRFSASSFVGQYLFYESLNAQSFNGGCSGTGEEKEYTVEEIKTAKANHDKVICVIHGGHEHYNLPSPRMQKQNRFYAKMVQISLSDIIPIALEDMRFTKAFLFITVWVTFCLP